MPTKPIIGYSAANTPIYGGAGTLTPNVPTTIPFSSVNTTPMNTPVVPPSTSGNGLSSYIENTVQNTNDQALTDSKNKVDESGNAYLKELLNSSNIASTVDYSGVDTAKKESDRLSAQIMGDAKATRDQIQTLKDTFSGSTEGLQQAIGSIQNKAANHQADLAILKYVADNDYQGAAQIADRQLQNKLEASRVRLDALKFIYQENKESFNKADERLYNAQIKKEDAALKKQTEIETDIKNVKLEASKNGADLATLQKIGKATTLDEAIQAAGQYGTDPLDRAIKKAQLANLTGKGSDIKIVKINGQDYIQNADGTFSKPQLPQNQADQQAIKDKVKKIDDILKSPALNTVVGPNVFARTDFLFHNKLSGATSNFKASIQQLTKELTLEKLQSAKAAGATFGALSEGELELLSGAATKLDNYAVKDKNGRVLYYNASEKDFKEELETIKNYTQRAVDLTTDNYINSLDSSLRSPQNLYLNAGYNTN